MSEITELQSQIDHLQSMVTVLNNDSGSSEIDFAVKKVDELAQQLKDLEFENRTLKTTLRTLSDQALAGFIPRISEHVADMVSDAHQKSQRDIDKQREDFDYRLDKSVGSIERDVQRTKSIVDSNADLAKKSLLKMFNDFAEGK